MEELSVWEVYGKLVVEVLGEMSMFYDMMFHEKCFTYIL